MTGRGRSAAARAAAAALLTLLLVVLPGLVGCTAGGRPGAEPTGRPSGSPSAVPPGGSPSAVPPASGVPSGPVAALPRPDSVLVVIFENQDADAVLGSADAPYLTSLAQRGTVFSDAHGVTHPSEPNYLALFSGSPQGVDDDSCPHTFSGPNLGRQLLDAGLTFTGYSEDLPRAGDDSCTAGRYARKHNPWVNFANLPPSVNQPYTAFPADLPAGSAALPTVAVVVPNLCNDMHDCDVRTGDDWARTHLAGYVAWAQDHNGLLVVTFDEDEGSRANRIATFLVGPMVRAGTSDQRIDHYSVLRTLEAMYGLPPLGGAAAAAPISGVWTR